MTSVRDILAIRKTLPIMRPTRNMKTDRNDDAVPVHLRSTGFGGTHFGVKSARAEKGNRSHTHERKTFSDRLHAKHANPRTTS